MNTTADTHTTPACSPRRLALPTPPMPPQTEWTEEERQWARDGNQEDIAWGRHMHVVLRRFLQTAARVKAKREAAAAAEVSAAAEATP